MEREFKVGEAIICPKCGILMTPANQIPRPVCPKCHCELRPETNGVGILDMADWGPYELYDADLWKCPSCGVEVVGGFGLNPIAQHYESPFQTLTDGYRVKGLLIENKG